MGSMDEVGEIVDRYWALTTGAPAALYGPYPG
jgi:hypothetical protein